MPCPCGYERECAIWCGNGHENGQCQANWIDFTLLVPLCPTCGDFPIESHPTLMIVRCANCKEWLI